MANIPTRTSKTQSTESAARSPSAPCIFIVNAEPGLRAIVEEALKREGCHVTVVDGNPDVLQYFSDVNEVIQKGRIGLRLAEHRILFDNKDIFGLTPKE